MKSARLFLPLVALLFGSAFAMTLLADEPAMVFRDADLPFEKRVDDLVSRLTSEEKIGQLMMDSPAIPRLEIPAYHWWNEGLHGLARNGVATVFPQAIGLAATWNPELHGRIADVISTEARAKNNDLIKRTGGNTQIYQGLTIWSPNINIFRDPRWGRGQETYGEDPFLTSCFGVAFVRGLQGNDPHYLKTVATLKHYAVHSGPEKLRHKFDAMVAERDLRETYLPAFEAGIREGGAWSIMSAYNAINGIPAPANKLLLSDILRGEWKFRGAVVGDVDTVADIWKEQSHRYAKDAAEASAAALKAGNDLCSGTTYKALPDALKRGLIAEADLDSALRKLFLLRFKLGQFDPKERVPYSSISIAENDSPAHEQLALEAARQSIVLLKNDGTLPWGVKTIKTLAVIGPTANDLSALVGNYNGVPSHPVTILKGLRNKLEPLGIKVIYEPAVSLVSGFRETGQPFSEGVLFTDETKTKPGLTGELFDNDKFQGTPIATRTDGQLDLFWNPAQPVRGLPVTNAKAVWTGVIVPPTTDEYTLSMSFIGSCMLYLDGKTIVSETNLHDPGDMRTRSEKVRLEAGHAYKIRIEFKQGGADAKIQFGWVPPGMENKAVPAIEHADHILLALGITPNLEGEEMRVNAEGFKGGDRTSILLPRIQRDLIDKVAALGKPFTIVLTNGSALSFDTAKPNAVLEAWYYGERGGDAIAEVLCGDCNPAGRLPVTFYQSDSDLPPFTDYSMTNRTYRYFTGKPLYPFGHGLSYTSFEYGEPKLAIAQVKSGDEVSLSLTIKNTGSYDGDEVLQVYARRLQNKTSQPIHSLVAFQRLNLTKGKSESVLLTFPAKQLRSWDTQKGGYVVEPGDYELQVGASSEDIRCKARVTVLAD